MKKSYAAILLFFAITAICLLVGCGNKGIGSDIKFLHFVDGNGQTVLDYQLDQYYNGNKLQQKLDETEIPYYTVDGGKYLDGTVFSVEKDKINDYIVNHNADYSITTKVLLGTLECPAYTVTLNLVPKEYAITYMDVEGATLEGPQTYGIESSATLPTPTKQYYHFLGWYEKVVNEGQSAEFVIDALPTSMPHDITLYAIWEPIKFDVTYQGLLEGVDNPNIKQTIYQKDGVYRLASVPSTAAYEFNGWKMNGEYVTEIDPVAIWDSSASFDDTDAYSVILTADIELYDFTANYYVDEKLYESKTFNYESFTSFVSPSIPAKEHYSARWSENVTEYKNYNINAIYEIDKFEVGVHTNIDGYSVDTATYEYGTTYRSVYEQLSYDNKVLVGLYYDEGMTNRVNEEDLITSGGWLYAKWYTRYSITSAGDWSLLSEHNDAQFVLGNDIDFKGEAIPIITNFNGILDGQNHAVSNFNNRNSSCDSTYGLFRQNIGIIRNINFTNGTYTAVSPEGAYDTHIGFLCGINRGIIDNVQASDLTVQISSQHSTKPLGADAGYSEVHLNAGVFAGTNIGTISNSTLERTVSAEMNTVMCSATGNGSSETFRTWAHYGLFAGTNQGQISHVTSSAVIYSEASRTDDKNVLLAAYYANVYFPLQIGGIAGNNSTDGIISDALCNAGVTAYHNLTAQRKFFGIVDAGGICGFNGGRINRCYVSPDTNLGVISKAEIRVGGICGINEGDNAVINASYSNAKFNFGNFGGENNYVGGITGINSATAMNSHAIIESITCSVRNSETGTNGVIGSLSGYAQKHSIFKNCFTVVNCNVSQLPINIPCSDIGISDGGTITKCRTYITAESIRFSDRYVTKCETEVDLLATIDKTEYEGMGFEIDVDGYPILPNAGDANEN